MLVHGCRAANLMTIRELILTTILATFRYENKFLSLNYVQNVLVLVSIKFDSRKRQQICTPVARSIIKSAKFGSITRYSIRSPPVDPSPPKYVYNTFCYFN